MGNKKSKNEQPEKKLPLNEDYQEVGKVYEGDPSPEEAPKGGDGSQPE